MPRPPRIDLLHIARHVVQCDNNRLPCLHAEIDYIRYPQDLRGIRQRDGCAVHAHVLMTNHVHLLLTPREPGQVSRVMQALGRRSVRYINHRYHRSGTLWEGRYKACLVACDHYLLHCHRYIELNPVRARIAADPAQYRWSSHRRLAFGSPDPSIALHDAFLRLSSHPHDWMTRYRQLVLEAISPEETEVIRRHLQRQHLYERMAYSGRSRPRQAKARGRRKWEDRARRMRSRLSEEVDSDPCFSSPGQPSWR